MQDMLVTPAATPTNALMDTNKNRRQFSDHNSNVPPCLSEQFYVLTKCTNKFDCLIKEMLFIKKLKPSLNVQTDSIRQRCSLEEFVILCYYVNS